MSFLAALPIIGNVIDGIFKTVDKLVLDKDQAEKLKAEIQLEAMKMDYTAYESEIKAQAAIITAEAQGKGWLQNNWRPLLMLLFGAIILNNQLVFPYATTFGFLVPSTPLPPEMWQLLKLGIGGYVVGRSAEKIIPGIVAAVKGSKDSNS